MLKRVWAEGLPYPLAQLKKSWNDEVTLELGAAGKLFNTTQINQALWQSRISLAQIKDTCIQKLLILSLGLEANENSIESIYAAVIADYISKEVVVPANCLCEGYDRIFFINYEKNDDSDKLYHDTISGAIFMYVHLTLLADRKYRDVFTNSKRKNADKLTVRFTSIGMQKLSKFIRYVEQTDFKYAIQDLDERQDFVRQAIKEIMSGSAVPSLDGIELSDWADKLFYTAFGCGVNVKTAVSMVEFDDFKQNHPVLVDILDMFNVEQIALIEKRYNTIRKSTVELARLRSMGYTAEQLKTLRQESEKGKVNLAEIGASGSGKADVKPVKQLVTFGKQIKPVK
jgi:hypothetical protein